MHQKCCAKKSPVLLSRISNPQPPRHMPDKQPTELPGDQSRQCFGNIFWGITLVKDCIDRRTCRHDIAEVLKRRHTLYKAKKNRNRPYYFRERESSPFPKQALVDSSKLKEFADDNFKFDEYDGKFSDRVENNFSFSHRVFKRLVLQIRKNGLQYKSLENSVGKGEIARYEQFLLFPRCFLPHLRTFHHIHQFKIVICTLFQFGRV